LDHGAVAPREIGVDRRDQRRQLHRQQDLAEEALLGRSRSATRRCLRAVEVAPLKPSVTRVARARPQVVVDDRLSRGSDNAQERGVVAEFPLSGANCCALFWLRTSAVSGPAEETIMLKLHDELIAKLTNFLTERNYNPVVVANHRLYARAFLDYLAECDIRVESVTPGRSISISTMRSRILRSGMAGIPARAGTSCRAPRSPSCFGLPKANGLPNQN
jgi:hypothetical protein